MANVNRYDSGEKQTIYATIASGVTVEMGDLMFLDNSNNLRANGSSTANNYAYPLKYLRISGSSLQLNKEATKARFLGVAMDDVDGIVNETQKITIATTGVFSFDLKPPKTVAIGDYFGPSGTTGASDMFNQKGMKTTDIDIAIGRITERKIHALSAKIFIRTAFSSYSSI